ncbi:hypothetical protein [Streptomyces sp. TRM75563]|uniref:hypothetical protein n=1 Tax=Streptomyces sp. TRM75563 TaxID=2817418 RepID=UPI001F603CFB|nr:hypothetical protein [Streptomyces sp. TRM75563]MCI4039897.1 hypothetical protein [Streptomyces sp. TRM75563]
MSSHDEDGRLSEDARAAVDALAQEWRRELEIRATIHADARGKRLVSRSDVVAAADSSSWKRLPVRRNRDYVIWLISGFAVSLAIAISVLYLDPDASAPVVAALLGTLAATVTLFNFRFTREKGAEVVPERALLVAEVIAQWADVEGFLRGFAPTEEDDGSRPVSLATIFRHYERRAPVSRETMEELHALLDTRNKLVHAHDSEISDEELRTAIEIAKGLKGELQRARDWGLQQ